MQQKPKNTTSMTHVPLPGRARREQLRTYAPPSLVALGDIRSVTMSGGTKSSDGVTTQYPF